MVKPIILEFNNTPQKTYRIAQYTVAWYLLHSLLPPVHGHAFARLGRLAPRFELRRSRQLRREPHSDEGEHPPLRGGDQHVHGAAHEPPLHGVHAQVPPRLDSENLVLLLKDFYLLHARTLARALTLKPTLARMHA